MAMQLPPPPPHGPNGFASSEWQRWFDTLRRQFLNGNFTSLTVSGPAGFNGKLAQGPYAVGAALVAYAPGANGLATAGAMAALVAKVTALETALINNGIAV